MFVTSKISGGGRNTASLKLRGKQFAFCARLELYFKNTTLKSIFKQITVLLTKSYLPHSEL
jgi:hypothetical protein